MADQLVGKNLNCLPCLNAGLRCELAYKSEKVL